jgi:hypothetical protein
MIEARVEALEQKVKELEDAVLWVTDILMGPTPEDDPTLQDEHQAFVERVRARQTEQGRT